MAAIAATSMAIYADEKGKNEWLIENLGQVTDAILLNSQQSYILSEDAVITHLDSQTQQTVWRKQLPQNSNESYRIRNVGRNILAFSDDRGIMLNSAGHIVFELPLEGTGTTVAEIYQDRNGEIVTCFVRNENFYVYRENQLKGSFQIISDLEDFPESFQEVFQPLQMFHDGTG